MKTSYPQIVPKYLPILIVLMLAVSIYMTVRSYLESGDWSNILFVLFFIVYSVFIMRNKIHITENNQIGNGGFHLDISSIYQIEYLDRGGVLIYYLFQGAERKTVINIKNEYRNKLLEDLKKINPNIQLKQETNETI